MYFVQLHTTQNPKTHIKNKQMKDSPSSLEQQKYEDKRNSTATTPNTVHTWNKRALT